MGAGANARACHRRGLDERSAAPPAADYARTRPPLRSRRTPVQTLHEWVEKAEVDGGMRAGVPSDVADRMNALERENRELRQANQILRKA